MHTIGIDFGTTKTLVSRIKSRTGEAETVRLGQGTDHIPTSVFIKDNGDMLFGDEADDRLTEADGVYLRGFKMSLGNSTPVYAQMNDEGELIQYMAAELVTRYLSYIRTRVQETVFAGEPITRAIITRPVEFSPARCEELRQAAIAAGFTEVELTTEPEAAGLAFCSLNDAQAFRHSALIVDWGGGTLDFALVTREEKHIITHPNLTAGDITMGGERFDHLLWSYAENQLRKHAIFNVNPVAMLPIIRKNKERLSASDTATLRLSHENGTCPPIELTQQLFNRLINDSVERAAGKIMQLLERIPEADKPEMLLLVGGSCRIPYIKRKLEEVCKLPAVAWHLSREAVSLGAALWDSATLLPPTPEGSVTPAGTETADVSIPETTTEQNSATQDTQTKPTHKRALNKVGALGTLLAAAVAAPLVYTHFSEEAEQAEAKVKAAEEARLKAEADAKAKAEEVAQLKAAEEAKAKAEQEARQKALAQAKQETEKITVAHSELDSILASLEKSICTSDDLKSIESKINDIKTIRDEVKMSIADIGRKAPSIPELTELNNLIASLVPKLSKADEKINQQKQQLTAKAEEEARLKAEREAKAQYNLGNSYFKGEGVNKDATEAVKCYQLAAEQGLAEAQCGLGFCYINGEGVKKDYAEAVKWFRLAAEQELAKAQLMLGFCYDNGVGVNKDAAEAVKWYREAADQGLAEAQYRLGCKYYFGEGVNKDAAEAVKWFRLAAEQGYDATQYNLGVCYAKGIGVNKDAAEAVKWYQMAAEQGYAKAQYNLGVCYEKGEGVNKNTAEAVKWYQLAAEQGLVEAQYNLGICYINGEGVNKDATEAVKWYRLAAEQGHANAQYNLGVCYINGEGVKKDDAEAVKWFRLATEQGDAKAQYNLGVCYEKGIGVNKDAAEAVKWYQMAAEQGFARPQCALGTSYLNGEGVKKDAAEAVKWYQMAAEHGHAGAQHNLGVCYKNGWGVEKNRQKAKEWYRKAAAQGMKEAEKALKNL